MCLFRCPCARLLTPPLPLPERLALPQILNMGRSIFENDSFMDYSSQSIYISKAAVSSQRRETISEGFMAKKHKCNPLLLRKQ